MKKVLIVILLMCISLVSFAERVDGEQTPIYPATLAIPIEKSKNIRTFTVYNTTTERKSFELMVKEQDNFNQVSEVAKYIKVFPRKFSLEPGKSKEVRVSVEDLPEEMLGKGEYKAALSIKGLSSKINEKYESKENNGQITTVLNIKINVNMGIYVLSGNEFEKVEITKFKINKLKNEYEGKINNTGNYSYSVIIKILDKDKNILSRKEKVKIFPGIANDVSFPIIKNADKIEIEVFEKEKILETLNIADLLSN